MSHTGFRGFDIRRLISDTGRVDYKPTKVLVDPNISIEGNHNGDEFIGQFSGNGERVLVGLSNLEDFTSDDSVFDGAQKGVAIGYTESDTHFNIYTNNGTNNPITVTQLFKLKDNENHNFIIQLYSNKLFVRFDGEEFTLTSNIPVLGDSLKLITEGMY